MKLELPRNVLFPSNDYLKLAHMAGWGQGVNCGSANMELRVVFFIAMKKQI
jgi:hypothetical protein